MLHLGLSSTPSAENCNDQLKCEAWIEYKGLNACEVRSDGAWNGGGVSYSDSWADSVAFIARTMRIG